MRILQILLKQKFAILAISTVTFCSSCSHVSNYSKTSNVRPTIKSNDKSGNSLISIHNDNRILNNEVIHREKTTPSAKKKRVITRKNSQPGKNIKAPDAWDHTAKQNSVWSCHTFVATGLVEAEYHRSTGEKIDLSEADLFLKHLKQDAPNWDTALSSYIAQGVKSKKPRDQEIGHVHESYDLIKNHGIAVEHEVEYSPTLSIGLPLSMSILRNSVDEVIEGVDDGEQQDKLTALEINKIKKGPAFNILSKEEQHFASREKIKEFTSQYTLESINIRDDVDNTTILKNLLNLGVVGLNYKVPSYQDPSKFFPKNHTVIITGYDAHKRVFSVRDSNYKGLFSKNILKEDFIKKYGTKVYYLQKR